MSTDDDTDELLFAAVYAEAMQNPFPIKRANPFPTRNPNSFIDPLMFARPVPTGDGNTLVDLMLKADANQGGPHQPD